MSRIRTHLDADDIGEAQLVVMRDLKVLRYRDVSAVPHRERELVRASPSELFDDTSRAAGGGGSSGDVCGDTDT